MSGNETAGRLQEPWDQMTLQSLAIRAAMEHPAQLFLVDCPDREAWNGVEPRRLTSDTFLKAATFLAAQLRTLGIAPGERVLLILPNIVEAPIAILACHLAGAIPALGAADDTVETLRAAAERCRAAMILTTGRVGEIALGEKSRLVAAKAMKVRAVAGFGFDLPDGIVSLEGWSDEDVNPLPEITRRQEEFGLITFARSAGHLVGRMRTEAQMVAEALALASVLRLDGRHGLISLMHPGAAATIAASLTLPLHAGASVRLVGPYATGTVAQVVAAEPTAFLYCPDHFAALLRADSFGPKALRDQAGILALARADRPDGALLPAGMLAANLVIDFAETGFMTRLGWPDNRRLDLPQRFEHPVEGMLPAGMPMLEFAEGDGAGARWSGFGAAGRLEPDAAGAAGRAA